MKSIILSGQKLMPDKVKLKVIVCLDFVNHRQKAIKANLNFRSKPDAFLEGMFNLNRKQCVQHG